MIKSTIGRTVRRMLRDKERLNKNEAIKIRQLILADGYVSRSEKKLVRSVIENDLLDEPAIEVLADLLYMKQNRNMKTG